MSPLLSTKLLIPQGRPDLVPRPHLVDRLLAGMDRGRRLSLVSAPPGFGKTILLRELATAGGTVVWLSLDGGDDSPASFFGYLRAAVFGALDGIPPEDAEDGAPPDPDRCLADVINRVARAESRVLVILDDYHSLRDFSVHERMTRLLETGPAQLHLAIGSREDPPLPLARLRAQDALTEIRAHDLRFNREEAGHFLRRTMALELTGEDIDLLAARTEGWITGLQLAGIALRPITEAAGMEKEAHRFVHEFSGDDRFVVDYLFAEVLERVPEAMRDFLRQTSILERLSAPLCDALTGADDSRRMLERLETGNLFLVPLDNRREWFRYHGLFAQVLRLSLTPLERRDLHRRAAMWFRTNGFQKESLHHERMAAGEGKGGNATDESDFVEPLSAREIEILQLVEAGLSNLEIGDRLVIAHSTVKRHVSNIYGKLQVGSRTQAVAAGRRLGLL